MVINFNDSESDFYQFMISKGHKNTRTKTNYLSWLRFLSNNYSIDNNLTNQKIDEIIEEEKVKRKLREKYTREKDVSDFRSALRKYLSFIETDFEQENINLIEEKIAIVKKDTSLTITEKNIIILSRVGQGKYRKELINYWQSSSINKYTRFDLLIASHIKPWKNCINSERTDLYNGLLLPPNYDKLFDRGYISFDKKGKIEFSKFLNEDDKIFFGLKKGICLLKIEEKHKTYLEYHKDVVLIK